LTDPASVGRLLVRAPNWLGDVVLALPALEALRRRFASASVTIVAREWAADLLRGHPHVDAVVVDERRRGSGSPLPVLGLARRIARERFDLAVVLSRSFASALAVRLAGVPLRAGLACQGRGALFTHSVRETEGHRLHRHHAEVFLDVARSVGAEGEARHARIVADAADEAAAMRLLVGAGLGPDEPFLAVHPGASRVERTWPAERFGSVARQAGEEHGLRILILGTSDEERVCRLAADAAGAEAACAVGAAGLRTLAAVHAKASLVLGNDSGAMHLAAATGTPVVGVFGPGDPRKTAPLAGDGAFEGVTLAFACSPCRQRFFHECRPADSGRPFCLHDLEEAQVLGAVRRQLHAARARR
jgi:lipopolysaccharide heptosyltransferase II